MTTELDSSTGTELAASMIDVNKSYKHFKLRNIHFSVQRGTVAGLIGPNGAGKSTTMRILKGLVQPDTGTVTALGKSISSSDAAAKQDIGYFSDDMRLYKPESVLAHCGPLYLVLSLSLRSHDGCHRFHFVVSR